METANKVLQAWRRECAMAACLAVLVAIASIGSARPAQKTNEQKGTRTAQPAEAGGKLFASMCAGCHGLDGRGGERGPDIAGRQQVTKLSDEETLGVLRKGVPAAGMPPFESLGEEKLKTLLGTVRKLQGREGVEALPGDPRQGKALFFGKARCSECHMMQGEGGFIGRDLSDYGAGLMAREIRVKLTGPAEEFSRANRMALVTLRDSTQITGVIRNEDNFSVQLQSLDGAFHFLARAEIRGIEFKKEPIMPTDYGTVLKASEIDDLVSYLIQAARKGSEERGKQGADEEE